MFGLCPPSRFNDAAGATDKPYAYDLTAGQLLQYRSRSDCRSEAGPKWDAIKAFSSL